VRCEPLSGAGSAGVNTGWGIGWVKALGGAYRREVTDALDSSALDALRASVGDDTAFLSELVATFLADAPQQLTELRAALASGNAQDVARDAHTLKSNAATFGIVRLNEICRDLEGRASEGNLEGADALVTAIGEALAEARPALEALTVLDGAR
jgi:HPt (histidine-containing phosphotransfer) domain-containing protein